MARWDHLPKITNNDLKRLYRARTERDYENYENFNEFCVAEYQRTERAINRILLKAGRRSPLTKKRIKLKEKRETEKTINQSFRAKFESFKSSVLTSPSPNDVRRDVRSDVLRSASDVPRPSREVIEGPEHRGNQRNKGIINEELSITKAHERHRLQVQPRTETQSDLLQQNELNAAVERETESGFYEDADSGAKARSHAVGRSHSGDTPDGEHSEDHQDLTDDDLEWLYSREELEERRRDLGTVWGRHR